MTAYPRRREEFKEILDWIDARIDGLERELQALKQLRELISSSIPSEAEAITPQDLDNLPWRPFREGGGEWIFEDEALEGLVNTLRGGGGKAVIGGYVYTIAEGVEKRFIRRKPLPQK